MHRGQAPLHYYNPLKTNTDTNKSPSTCFRSFLKILCKAFIICIVFAVAAAVILWLIVWPLRIKVTVDAASLTRFALLPTNPPYLYYNLSIVVSFRNPTKKLGIYYDWLEADSFYESARFSRVALPTFYLDGKNSTTTMRSVMEGNFYTFLDSSGVEEFKNENKTGFFDVKVWLNGRVRYKLGSMITNNYSLRVKCPLRLQLVRVGVKVNEFKRTNCRVANY
ncbi:NDR1/HIN1-like protein 10 [Typha angustifolia]|uniref:NDR1/HIN1-like protein 10 n=1 Tax=Typha angustifolia TaxID=59011 RepID=UPI003C2EBC37